MQQWCEHKHAQCDWLACLRILADSQCVCVQRALDIRFVPAVLEQARNQTLQGAAFEGEKIYVNSKE